MSKRILLLLLALTICTNSIRGQTAETNLLDRFFKSHQLGVRMGVWANMGDIPPGLPFDQDSNFTLTSKITNSNFYFEGYFAYRISRLMMMELSFGMSNRGSFTLTESGTTNVGNLIIYPMLLQAKFYPFSVIRSRIQPYFTGGGGMYYGRRSTQISTTGFIFTRDETGTDFYYSIGGGIDMTLASSLGLELNAKYMPINFSNSLIEIEKYDGLSITIGLKYFYIQNKDDNSRKGRHRENRN